MSERVWKPAKVAVRAPLAASDFGMPNATHTWEERGGWLVNRLATVFHLEPYQSAGIVGNLGFESVGFTKLHEIGQPKGQGGYGWAQWTGPRRILFLGYAHDNNLDWRSDEANYGYLVLELRKSMRNTISAVRRASSLEAAVWSVGQTFERPGGTTSDHLPGFEGRTRYASRAMAGSGATPPIPRLPLPVPQADKVGPVVAAIKVLQIALEPWGYIGPIDGDLGPNASAALRAYQDRAR